MNSTARAKLSAMMFLQFAIWGSWFVTMSTYLLQVGFDGLQVGAAYSTMNWGAIFAPIVAGAANMRYPRFAVFNFTGALLWAVGLPVAGFMLGEAMGEQLDRWLLVVLAVVFTLSILPTAIHLLRSNRGAIRSQLATLTRRGGEAQARPRGRCRDASVRASCSSLALLPAHVGDERVDLLAGQALLEVLGHDAGLVALDDDRVRILDRLAHVVGNRLAGLPGRGGEVVERGADLRVRPGLLEGVAGAAAGRGERLRAELLLCGADRGARLTVM